MTSKLRVLKYIFLYQFILFFVSFLSQGQNINYSLKWNNLSGSYAGSTFNNQALTLTFTNVPINSVTTWPSNPSNYQVVFSNGQNVKITLGNILNNVPLDNVSSNSIALLATSSDIYMGATNGTNYDADRGSLGNFSPNPSASSKLTTSWNSNAGSANIISQYSNLRFIINGNALNINPATTTGAWGDSTPSGSAPSAPTNLTATAGNGQAQLSFTAGADGGAAITNYEYSSNGGTTWTALNPVDATSPITIPGLTNGTQYSFQLRAVNSVGSGASSSAVTVTPSPPVYYADSVNGNDANSGLLGFPKKTFNAVYSIAPAGSIIDLTGTFTWTDSDETGDASVTGYTLDKSLIIQGQGAGSTIIQSASSRNTADRRVFTINNATAITIKNLSIRYGKIGSGQSGAGIRIQSSNQPINLENLIIEQNDQTAAGYNYGGGGLAILNSNNTADVNIINCQISNNAASGWGGGMYISGSSGSSSNITLIKNCTFSGNTTSDNGAAIGTYYSRNVVMINSTATGNTGPATIIFSNHSTGSAYFLNNTIAYNTNSSNSVYLEFVNSATLQNNIIAENRNSSNVLVGYITQRNNVPAYYNNIIDFIPTNWSASNDVQNGVNGNIVGTNVSLGLSNTLALNSSTGITKTLSISCASVATNAGSNTNYGYVVPTTDQRGISRLGATDIGSFENIGTSEIAYTGSITTFTKCGSNPSSNQSIVVSGCNLTNDISISAPSGFELSTNASTGFANSLTLTQSGGTVASTTIYVRMTASASGSPSGNISLTSTGATPTAIAVTGSASTLSIGTANSNQVLCDATNASDIVLTGSSGTIQWLQSSNNNTWTNISSATNATLTSAQIGTVASTTFIRAQVTSGSCSGNSNTVVLKVNNALAFDGTGDFVPLGTNTALNLMSNLTLEAWVYVPATPKTSINTIFSKNYTNLGNPGYMFGFNNWNTTNLKIIFEDGASAFNSNQALTAGAWNHAAVVVSGNGTIGNFYINGLPAGSFAATLTDASAVAEFIGSMDSSGSYSLKGTLDELRIWNVARTQQEIIDNMDNTLSGSETGLVAYYDFDQGIPGGSNTAITSVLNKTSNALNGTFTGISRTGTTSNFVSSTLSNFIISGAATICGNSSSQYTHPISAGTWTLSNGAQATISSTGLLTSTIAETLTISYSYIMNGCSKTDTKVVTVYATPTSPTAATTIYYCQGATASALTATATTGNTLQWYTVSTGGTASTIAPSPLTTTLGATIYYVSQKNNTSNCESPRTAITVNVIGTPTISGAQNMFVGGNRLQLTGSGTPDATTPWTSSNSAVATISSTGEVTSVGSGTTTITYTTSSGCSIATTIKVIDCAAPFGNSMSFDGVDDYVTVGDNLESLADLTQEAWVYWRGSTNAYSEIFTKDLVSAFAITSTNKLHANFGNGTTWDSGLNSTASIPLNTWTHLAVTRQSGVVKLFINGKQDSSTTTLSATGQNSSHRAIGAKLVGTSLYANSGINAQIDEVRFWSSARTESQIQASMNTELAGNESGLLAYYTFNNGIAGGNNTSVNTIVNLANNTSNGTITNSDKSGTNSNLVLGVTANFSIAGATNVCGNSTSQYTHPIVGGSWSVSNGAISTISTTGLLTNTTGETITISYTYMLNGCSFTDTKSVTIQIPVISGLSTTGIGEQLTLTATTPPANSNAWISSNTTVATISNLGLVSGLTLGTTSITFTNTNGCTATQTITVVTGATQTPILTSPAANTTGATTLNINYTLPETPLAGRVKLMFTPSSGGSPIVWTMTDATSVTFSHVVGTDPLVANSANVISGTALSFTTYNLTLSYQDANGNPVAQVTNANIQTLAPPSISFSAASYQGIVNTSLVAIPTINTGGTGTYSVSPSLPSGVLISASTGVISGVPTVAISTRQYTVTATNAAGNSSATFNLFIDSDTDGDGIGNTTDLDIDGDGVPNSVEIQQGTSPTIPGARDTDGDGVPDYVEQQQGTNPTTPGAQDTDGDGVPDYVEQQQGTSPTTSGAQDTDGDGVPDYVEQQQGTSPTTPGAQDTDGDGVPDYVEQQQGTSPTTPGDSLLDTDGDGVPNYVEQQQGTSPTTPGAQDTDGDGVPDYVEQQQGTSPTTPGSRDTDGDGVPDYVEQQQGTSPTTPGDSLLDTDSDGVPDYVEQQQGTSPTTPGAQDTDGDGVPDYVEQQQGTSPTTPGSRDTDGDGVPDYVEQQQGTSPTTPGSRDTDGDGVPDYVEQQQGTSPTTPGDNLIDTDGDGVPNYVEQQQGTSPTTPGAQDTDGDGVPDYVEQQQGTSPTTPGSRDTDGDGVPDYVEQQQGTSPTTPGSRDTDGDGVPDYVEQQQGTSPTTPGDSLLDTDGDGVPNYVEQQQGTSPTTPGAQDTDGDGVPDYVEQQQGTSPTTPGSRDTDGDGVPDYVEQQQGTSPTTPGDTLLDTDGDGVSDYVEQQQGTSPSTPGDSLLDTDADGVPNYIELQQGTSPAIPGARDTDGDGVPDYVEQQQGTSPTTPGAQDTDGDGVPDYVEQQQGTSPTTPGSRDTDGDGVPDYIEVQQGTSPTISGDRLLDTDADGVPNYIEVQQGTNPRSPGARDTDGDGVPDYVEQQQGTSPTTPGARDTDGDGVPDYVEQQQGTSPTTPGARDTDGDGVPDYVEQQQGSNPSVVDATDSDNDGMSNYEEGYNYRNPGASLDTDRDGTPDYLDLDSDGDGILDRYDAFPRNKLEWKDTDGDGSGDNTDSDDDNDSILDTCDVDTNGDGIPDNGIDMDGDGVIDTCDTDKDGDGVNNTSDNCPEKSNPGQADRDRDGKGDLCDNVELNTMEAITPNGDGINDTWVIYNIENHPGSTVRVFNSNGTQVFYSSNYQNNWAGSYQGSSEMLPVGSYLYQIDLGGDGTIDSQGWLYITK